VSRETLSADRNLSLEEKKGERGRASEGSVGEPEAGENAEKGADEELRLTGKGRKKGKDQKRVRSKEEACTVAAVSVQERPLREQK